MASFPKPKTVGTGNSDEPSLSFLKAEHIGKNGRTAKLTIAGKARMIKSQFGQQVAVPVKHKGQLYDLAIGIDKPNYSIMWNKFGNPKSWKGTIDVRVEKASRGTLYIAVVE